MNLPHPFRGLRSALTLLLCALFFLLAMGLVLLSSGVYRGVAAASDENFTHRTALSYLVNQVRRGDVSGGVSLGRFGGGDALYLREDGYVTILYCCGGQLMELYMEDGLDLPPEAGMAVLPLDGLTLTADGATLTITAQGRSVALTPRSGLTTEVAA